MSINLPFLYLEFDCVKSILKLDHRNFYPEPYKRENSSYKIIIIGSPIIRDRVACKEICKDIFSSGGVDKEYARQLNGEFLIVVHNKNKKELTLINDRFCSIPIYYFLGNNKIHLSHNYIDLVKRASLEKNFTLKKEVFFEFLWFRRIHGDTTYDNKTLFFKSARILKYKQNKIKINPYWRHSFNKNKLTLEENSYELSSRLIQSIERKTADLGGRRTGLFLSGGMDTRAVLAAFIASKANNPSCFTVGYTEKGEYKTAKELTKKTNIEHSFIELPQDYYDLHWDEKALLSSGFYHQFANIFLGYSDQIKSHADVLFHGHGFDYLFQGMYLPTESIKLFKYPTYFNKVFDLNSVDDLSKYYIYNAPHRNWRVNPVDYLVASEQNNMVNSIYNNIKKVETEGMDICSDNFDMWEYIMTHTISRHYSQLDILAMGTNGEQRKIANDNDIFDLYLSMPLKHRRYAKVMRGALKNLSNEFSNIASANTGYKINSGPLSHTLHFAWYKILRNLTGNMKYRHPQANERTWPSEDHQVRDLKKLRHHVENLHNSEYLRHAMPYINYDKLKKDTSHWLNHSKAGGGQFLLCLLSIEQFLKKV